MDSGVDGIAVMCVAVFRAKTLWPSRSAETMPRSVAFATGN